MIENEIALAEAIEAWRDANGGFAAVLRALADASVVKGAVLIAFAVAAVARAGAPFLLARDAFLLRFTGSALTALAAGRILQTLLPHRDRPIVELSAWAANSSFASESSFPSDHAVYMTAMATMILLVDRRLGMLALVWTAFIILLPRVLLNFHYPTDILAGAAVGAAIAILFKLAPMPSAFTARAAATEIKAPQIVYPLAFLVAVEAATNFNAVRAIGSTLLKSF